MQKIDIKSFSLACGISAGLWFLFLGWIAMFGWGNIIVWIMSSVYIGYSASFWGAIIGGIWAFFDWAIGAAIVAWLYNDFITKRKKKIEDHKSEQ